MIHFGKCIEELFKNKSEFLINSEYYKFTGIYYRLIPNSLINKFTNNRNKKNLKNINLDIDLSIEYITKDIVKIPLIFKLNQLNIEYVSSQQKSITLRINAKNHEFLARAAVLCYFGKEQMLSAPNSFHLLDDDYMVLILKKWYPMIKLENLKMQYMLIPELEYLSDFLIGKAKTDILMNDVDFD